MISETDADRALIDAIGAQLPPWPGEPLPAPSSPSIRIGIVRDGHAVELLGEIPAAAFRCGLMRLDGDTMCFLVGPQAGLIARVGMGNTPEVSAQIRAAVAWLTAEVERG